MREVLIVENNSGLTSQIEEELPFECNIHCAKTLGEAISSLRKNFKPHLLLLDMKLPDSKGINSLMSIYRVAGALASVVLIHENEEELGMKAMKNGAQDYLIKETDITRPLMNRVLNYAIERHKTTSELRQKEWYLKMVRNIADMATWSWRPETDEFFPGKGFYEVSELEDGSIYSMEKLLSYCPDDLREKVENYIDHQQNKLAPISVEFRFSSERVEPKYFLLKGELMEGYGQTSPIYYGTIQDITTTTVRSETLEQRNRYLEIVGEMTTIGGWEMDLKEQKLTWTSNTLKLHGVQKDYEPTLEEAIEFYHPDDREAFLKSWQHLLETGESYSAQARIILADGSVRWTHSIGKPVYSNGEIVKVGGAIQDITKFVQTNEEISIRSSLLENVGDATTATDPNGNIIFWNLAAEQLYGYTREEVTGKFLGDFDLFAFSKEEQKERLWVLRNGKTLSGEFQMRNKAGNIFTVSAINSPVYAKDGSLQAVVSISRDITKEKEDLQLIQQSEARFRRIFENSPVGIALADVATGTWKDSNLAMSKAIGYSKAEIKGLSYDKITPDEYAAEDKKQGDILKSKGVFGPYSKEYIHKEGHRVKVIVTGFSTEHPTRGLQVWTHVMDLSEIEAKTAALKKSEERFKSYVENASDMIFTIDDEGHFTYISPNVKKIFGFTPEEVLRTPVTDYIHPDDVGQTQQKYERGMIDLTEPFRLTLRIRHKNGNYKYLEADGSMHQSKSEGLYGIVVARDIDEKQKSRLQILDQNARLRDIAFVQSHILRKPMANILGILNQEGLEEGKSDESKKLHELLKEQVVLMDGIVRRIVDKSTKIKEMK